MIMNVKKIVYVLWYGNRNLSRNCERLPAYSSNILAYMTNLGNEKKKVKNKLVHFRNGICILPKMIPPEHRKTLNKNCARGQQKTSLRLAVIIHRLTGHAGYPRPAKMPLPQSGCLSSLVFGLLPGTETEDC